MRFKSTWTPAAWVKDFEQLPAPESAERAIALRVLSVLQGYRRDSQHRAEDVHALEQALIGYVQMLHKHGVVSTAAPADSNIIAPIPG